MKTQDQVFKVLMHRAEARDNDNYLIWLVWQNFYKVSMADMMTFRDDFINNKIPSADSITRYRRKIQEEHIELRGKKYDERQNKTKKVKTDLGY